MELDCPTFRKENPLTFKACGWTHCEKHFWEIWKHAPLKEYNMWIPELLNEVSIFTFSEKNNLCWAFFSRVFLDFSKPMEQQKDIRKKGYKVRAYGDTLKTKKKWECGNGSIKNLLNFSFNI